MLLPTLNIAPVDPPVYPHLSLYPPKVAAPSGGSPADRSIPRLPALYPTLQIYEVVYPFFDIYPAPAGRYEAPGVRASVPEQSKLRIHAACCCSEADYASFAARPRKTHLMLRECFQTA